MSRPRRRPWGSAGRRVAQQDACRLGLSWVTGTVYPDEEVRQRFTVRFARRLDQGGYVRFRHWRIYGERGLAGEHGAVWLDGENLTVHVAADPLAQYKVTYERDQKGLKTVTEPRLFETHFRLPQLALRELGPEDWQMILRLPEYAPRCRAVRTGIQLPRLPAEAEPSSVR